jgi:hypothetical protein
MQKRLLKNRTSQNGYYNSVRDLNRMVALASIQTKPIANPVGKGSGN